MTPAQPPRGIQTLIHYMEVGAGRHWMQGLLIVILVGAAAALYQLNDARNFYAPDAMDAAQLGRNLANGKGYTTDFIRPLSLHLLQQDALREGRDPRAILSQPHPDLQNPPVYPALLAALFKALPAAWETELPKNEFRNRPYAEVAISLLNLAVFGIVIALVWSLGSRLFDSTAGALAALITAGTEPIWQFVNSGLPTLLLMALSLLLLHALLSFEREAAEPAPRPGRLLWHAAAVGAALGLMFLTQYSWGWLALPILGYVAWRSAAHRGRLVLVTAVVFFALAGPWLARNWQLSRTPFGTAGYAVFSGAASFPGDRIERSQNPELESGLALEVVRKTIQNLRQIVRDDLPRLGGNWLAMLFLAGLLVPFQNPSLNRLRFLVLAFVAVTAVVQAAGRTWITANFGAFTGENLLMVLGPAVFVFGAGFLLTLIDHIEWPGFLARRLALGSIVTVLVSPFLLALLPPREITLVEPYRPMVIRQLASFSPPGTLFMSDVPWAVAWYGPRECVWATLRVTEQAADNVANRREDFFTFADARRPVQAVYISPYWGNQPYHSRYLTDPDFEWGRIYLNAVERGALPSEFPLREVLGGPYLRAGHFLLASQNWWSRSQTRGSEPKAAP